MDNAAPLIKVEDLKKSYGRGETATEVLKGLNFTIPRGQMTALLGPSGSGKSTLLTIMGTLLKPTSGRFYMLGQDVTALEEPALSRFRNRNIGFVFQFHHLLPDFTALENVYFPMAAPAGYVDKAMVERAKMLLDKVGLAHRRTYLATELSGGQKQRVAIARALMNNPALILADEPTGNLDRESADQVMHLLEDLNRSDNLTCLISTHAPEIAARCTARLQIDDGNLV